MIVRLDQVELQYLAAHLLPALSPGDEVRIVRRTGHEYELDMTEEVACKLSEGCMDRFMRIGLEADYEPNDEGRFLDDRAGLLNPAS